ncbi:lactate dehydrogenase [Anaerotignum lactatifermentans]|uniref:Lactate dehydrogenase n=1 Tax=Anaerotignum lactatifermentans TaxID=160404 RepID=A0ABS2G841_9FIRM|nr:lactate dehydrogenase [Anaerotignum lactatifermentans]MBM6828014.1 lactate dehydrogenase [Anaerotignum lactatifermentans]MBM6876823.1 lactate dehydrogenase [Anaerotignum lactatifermentans]MBM6949597.1 lactate dehydrogenase [Anaerotignum lactatifermentans]
MEVLKIDGKTVYLGKRNPSGNKGLCRITHPAMLAGEESLEWLDEHFLEKQEQTMEASFVKEIQTAMAEGEVYFANLSYGTQEEWTQRLKSLKKEKKRLHLLALGDVGSTVLMALKLMGGDCLEAIGIYDMNPAVCDRWERELNQAAFPWDYDRLPPVEILTEEALFDCDMFVFCASKGIPPVGQEQVDVRMVQFEANRSIVSMFAKKARKAGFQGIFAVVSDPVDPLCRAAFLASNEGEEGQMDYKGLRPEQIQGYGLGVMNARAAYYAKKDSRFASFLTEGRAFGPHGEDLVIANSISHYDDTLSKELAKLAVEANLRMRELGFKPYVAPAISSAAISLLLTLRGEWHYSSNFLAGVYMGCKNKTERTAQMEVLPLPEALLARIRKAYDGLEAIR